MRISDWSSDVCSSDLVRQTVNPTLDIQGVVLTMFDSRNNLAQQVVNDVRTYLGDKVYHTLIPRNVRVSEADRKSVVEGKSVSVRVGLGGRRSIKKKTTTNQPVGSYDHRYSKKT